MTNIVDFNNTDGLPPLVIQKLNNNFWNIIRKIVDPEVVMVSGSTLPNPRTNETLFYNNDTGDLYIWKKIDASNWGWVLTDIGYIHIDDKAPYDPSCTYTRVSEFIWINTTGGSEGFVYFWDGNDIEGYAWHSFKSLVELYVSEILADYDVVGNHIVIPDENIALSLLVSFLQDYSDYPPA